MEMTFGFIGLGLIGGSLAIELRDLFPHCRIMAYTRTKATTLQAQEAGVINTICESPGDPHFASCDMIFLCAPVGHNIKALGMLKDIIKEDCLITDVGSVKTGIHEAAAALGLENQFIGGHPMTGSEKSGFANANDHLFENAFYIITPTNTCDPKQLEFYRGLVTDIGAIPLVLDYREHDFITAAISHLPHVIASSLVNTVHTLDNPEEHMKLIAAGGFRDITRIASSSPEMWEQICVDNCENISRVMDEFIAQLSRSRDHMKAGDGAYINNMFRESGEYRNSFSFRSTGPLKKEHKIYCDIVDESGAIATIATILACSGINIKNISIVHNREYEEGALRILFYDEEATKNAARILKHHRYQVWEA